MRRRGYDLGEAGLSDPRRAIQDDRGNPIRLDRPPEQFAFTKDAPLTYKIFQAPGPHSRRQRRIGGLGHMLVLKQILHSPPIAWSWSPRRLHVAAKRRRKIFPGFAFGYCLPRRVAAKLLSPERS